MTTSLQDCGKVRKVREYRKEINETNISKVEEISGFGVIANVEGKDILVGNEKLMK